VIIGFSLVGFSLIVSVFLLVAVVLREGMVSISDKKGTGKNVFFFNLFLGAMEHVKLNF
jgi:hypothetical protein